MGTLKWTCIEKKTVQISCLQIIFIGYTMYLKVIIIGELEKAQRKSYFDSEGIVFGFRIRKN